MASCPNLGFLEEYIIKHNFMLPLNEIFDDEDFLEELSKQDENLLK
jgi:hypothetical protein